MAKHSVYAASKVFGEEKFHVVLLFLSSRGNLKPSDIQELLDEMQPNYSYSTIRKVYLFLHSMVKYGKTEKNLPKTYDPFITVEMPDEAD